MRLTTAGLALLVAMAEPCATAANGGEPLRHCGIEAVLSLAAALARPPSSEQRAALQRQVVGPLVSLRTVREMAQALGIPTTPIRASLDELLDMNRPVIIHLACPDHYQVLLDGGPTELRTIGADGTVSSLDRAAVAARFDGPALVPELAVPAARPEARVACPVVRVGTVRGTTILSPTFRLENRGHAVLTVVVSGRSCACTQVPLDTKSVAPGQALELPIEIRVDQAGPIDASVTIQTNDPYRPRIVLSVLGQRRPALQVHPEALRLQADAADRSAEVLLVGPIDLVVRQTDVIPAGIEVAAVGQGSDGARRWWRLRVTASAATWPVGETVGRLAILTNQDEGRTLTVPLAIVRSGAVVAEPARLFLGRCSVGAQVTATVRLRRRDGLPWRLIEVSHDSLAVRCRVVQRSAYEWSAEITVVPLVRGMLDTILRIVPDMPGQTTAVPLTLLAE